MNMNYLTMVSKDKPRIMLIIIHNVLFLTTCGADVHHKENECETVSVRGLPFISTGFGEIKCYFKHNFLQIPADPEIIGFIES